MTNTEAIEMLKQWNEDLSFFDDEKDGIECHTLAISALKKQIPKKPIMIGDNYSSILSCDSCKKPIVNVWNVSEYKPKYCHYCGQAIDWGDE